MDSVHHQEEAVHMVVLDRLYVNANQDLQDRDANRKTHVYRILAVITANVCHKVLHTCANVTKDILDKTVRLEILVSQTHVKMALYV